MSKSLHHAIYVPGLGDSDAPQTAALKFWRHYGVQVHYQHMEWSKGDFEPKLAKISHRIDDLHKRFGKVSLIGTSAGASGAFNAYAQRQDSISNLVSICGKITNIDTITPNSRLQENPAFTQSLDMLPASLESIPTGQRTNMLSLHPLYDGVVPVADTYLDGARQGVILSVGHVLSIATALTLYGPRIAHFVKNN